jgi:hypothetical protein
MTDIKVSIKNGIYISLQKVENSNQDEWIGKYFGATKRSLPKLTLTILS